MALANVLASAQAVEMGIYVLRAFVQLRQASAVHADLAKRLTELDALAGGIWGGTSGSMCGCASNMRMNPVDFNPLR